MDIKKIVLILAAVGMMNTTAQAALVSAGTWNGNVGLSTDAVGSNNFNVGSVQAYIPVGATILQAYLYSAGIPTAYSGSPTSLADYNAAGITLGGYNINNFSTLVGATSPRPEITSWATARADVTSVVQTLASGASTANFSWNVTEGSLNRYIDGEILSIVYSHPDLPVGSVALLNGGQSTAGETTNVSLGVPLTDTSAPGFKAELGLGISFSCCGQLSSVSINGNQLTASAGNYDDGLDAQDGSLITVGGLGDTAQNGLSYESDRELYDLKPFLNTGDTSFSIFTENPTADDNIFFASLYLTGTIRDVTPGTVVPEPETYAMLLAGLGIIASAARRKSLKR